jgi:hypothetical protein
MARRVRLRLREDRGSSPVELAIVAAGMLFITFAVIQVGLVFYARSLALAAASQAATAGRGFTAPPDAADHAAATFLNQAGDGLTHQHVTVERAGNGVTVTVTGDAISVLPGLRFHISQSAHASDEQVTP